MANPLPTLKQLQNPDQNLRLVRQIVERLDAVEGQGTKLAAGVASIPTAPDPREWLEQNGQSALALLNVDVAATAKTNVADSAPTANDDATKGYGYFSRWINTSGPTLLTCIDPSPGAAVWV